MTEDEWRRRAASMPVGNTTNIISSTVGSIAQVSGSHGTHITQTQTGSGDLQSLTSAIDRLVGAIKANPSLAAEVRNDAVIEGEQLKGELQKSKPNPSRIQAALEWFKTIDGIATAVAHLPDLVNKLKTFFRPSFDFNRQRQTKFRRYSHVPKIGRAHV